MPWPVACGFYVIFVCFLFLFLVCIYIYMGWGWVGWGGVGWWVYWGPDNHVLDTMLTTHVKVTWKMALMLRWYHVASTCMYFRWGGVGGWINVLTTTSLILRWQQMLKKLGRRSWCYLENMLQALVSTLGAVGWRGCINVLTTTSSILRWQHMLNELGSRSPCCVDNMLQALVCTCGGVGWGVY